MLKGTGQSQLLLRKLHSQVTHLQVEARTWLPSHLPGARLAPSARCPTSCALPAPFVPRLPASSEPHPVLPPLPCAGETPVPNSTEVPAHPCPSGPPTPAASDHLPPPGSRRSGLVPRPPRGLRRPLTAGGHGPERRRGTTAPSTPCATAWRHGAAGSAQPAGS